MLSAFLEPRLEKSIDNAKEESKTNQIKLADCKQIFLKNQFPAMA
jgi:hypothetical protein